jgi:hypothetical protein
MLHRRTVGNTMCGNPRKSRLRSLHTSLQQIYRTAFGSSRLRIRFHRMRRSGVYLPSRNNRTVRGFPVQFSSVLRPAIFFGRFSVEGCPTAIRATDLSGTARDPSRSTLGHEERKREELGAPAVTPYQNNYRACTTLDSFPVRTNGNVHETTMLKGK